MGPVGTVWSAGRRESDEPQGLAASDFLSSRGTRISVHKVHPRRSVDPMAPADGFMSAFEGAFILSKSLNEADIIVKQLRLYQTTIDALFLPD